MWIKRNSPVSAVLAPTGRRAWENRRKESIKESGTANNSGVKHCARSTSLGLLAKASSPKKRD